MTDTERETAISQACEEMLEHGRLFLHHKKAARAAQERMCALIRERTPEQVARMELEPGLA